MATKQTSPAGGKSRRFAWTVPKPLPIITLLIGLALSVFNLWLMTSQAGTLSGVTESFDVLQKNYAQRTTSPQKSAPPDAMVKKEAETKPVVMFSVVKFRDGEEGALRSALTEPLTAFYAEARWPVPLTAVLVERKNASSKDVNVRLFFSDGSEQAYLWPSKNSDGGKWVPPCSADPVAASTNLPLCPPIFSTKYPDLVDLTR